jgi:DNA topoisomerase I
VLGLSALAETGPCETQREANQAVVAAVKRVAAELGNRPAICRKYYVHPAVIEAFLEGALPGTAAAEPPDETDPTGLRRLEARLLELLQERNGNGG